MKRVIVIILLLTLITAAFADTIDVSTMTTDELIELRHILDDELSKRLIGFFDEIHQGYYAVGEGIKEGMYLLTCSDPGSNYNYGGIRLWTSDDTYTPESVNVGETLQIVLSEGMTLEIAHGIFSIQMLSKPAWMP